MAHGSCLFAARACSSSTPTAPACTRSATGGGQTGHRTDRGSPSPRTPARTRASLRSRPTEATKGTVPRRLAAAVVARRLAARREHQPRHLRRLRRQWHRDRVGPGGRGVRVGADGRRLAVSNGPHNAAIYLVNADGSGERQLTHPGTRSDWYPRWSPDGKRISFERGTYDYNADDLENTRVWIMNGDGSRPAQVRPKAVPPPESSAWSPDGGRLRSRADGELYLAAADGSGRTQLHPHHTRRRTKRSRDPQGHDKPAARDGAGNRDERRHGVFRVDDRAARPRLLRNPNRPLRRQDGQAARRCRRSDATDPGIAAAGTNVVYRPGKTIYLLDAKNLTARVLAQAHSVPIGLSIEGHRVAWAENTDGRGRIEA